MLQYDVKSASIAASQTDSAAFGGRVRLKGLVVSVPTAGGTLTIKNGAAGTTLFSFVAPAAAGAVNISIPGDGIVFSNGIYVTTPANMTAVIFYG
jgi:hypothetical protein